MRSISRHQRPSEGYRKELGSDLLDRIVAEPGSHRFISRFTILEMESVLALKFRSRRN